MFLVDNMVVDIEMNVNLESELIQCLVDANYRILFSVDEPVGYDVVKELFPSISIQEENILSNIEGQKEWLEFIEKRIVESTYDNFMELPFYEEGKVNWYAPKNINELKKIIRKNGLCYNCYIVHQHKSIKKYLIEVDVYEHINYYGFEYRCMIITPRTKGYDMRNKLGKIETVIERWYRVNKRE